MHLALIIPSIIAAAGTANDAPIMLKIIFWLLLLLSAIGWIGFRDNATWQRGGNIVLIILFAILGFYTFGF